MTISSFETVLLPIAFFLLFSLMILYWAQAAFFGCSRYTRLNKLSFQATTLSLTTLLVVRWTESGHIPVSNLYESLIFLSWSFLVIKIVFFFQPESIPSLVPGFSEMQERRTHNFFQFGDLTAYSSLRASTHELEPVKREQDLGGKTGAESTKNESLFGLGVVLSPMSFLSFAFAFLSLPKDMQRATSLVPALQSNWLMMHVTVMIVSYAALLCGSILSLAFLLVTRFQTSPENDLHLVSKLTRLDNLSYRALAFGFPFLSVGILSGAIWANEAWGSYWSWDPKETWALITWLVYAIYFHARITKGWSGEKAALVAGIGFFVVLFCYLGVNLLGTGLHSYGWFSSS